ncbi:MAG: hypothetical protein J3Q66DRAFT_333038 [Benniella sp.]|nr:MAG: hypothetical protein J3Q66DRAFT_333038 [Benniella sp.]
MSEDVEVEFVDMADAWLHVFLMSICELNDPLEHLENQPEDLKKQWGYICKGLHQELDTDHIEKEYMLEQGFQHEFIIRIHLATFAHHLFTLDQELQNFQKATEEYRSLFIPSNIDLSDDKHPPQKETFDDLLVTVLVLYYKQNDVASKKATKETVRALCNSETVPLLTRVPEKDRSLIFKVAATLSNNDEEFRDHRGEVMKRVVQQIRQKLDDVKPPKYAHLVTKYTNMRDAWRALRQGRSGQLKGDVEKPKDQDMFSVQSQQDGDGRDDTKQPKDDHDMFSVQSQCGGSAKPKDDQDMFSVQSHQHESGRVRPSKLLPNVSVEDASIYNEKSTALPAGNLAGVTEVDQSQHSITTILSEEVLSSQEGQSTRSAVFTPLRKPPPPRPTAGEKGKQVKRALTPSDTEEKRAETPPHPPRRRRLIREEGDGGYEEDPFMTDSSQPMASPPPLRSPSVKPETSGNNAGEGSSRRPMTMSPPLSRPRPAVKQTKTTKYNRWTKEEEAKLMELAKEFKYEPGEENGRKRNFKWAEIKRFDEANDNILRYRSQTNLKDKYRDLTDHGQHRQAISERYRSREPSVGGSRMKSKSRTPSIL